LKILFGTLAAVIIPGRMPAPTVKEITAASLKY
jgi:hypothetical protein